MHVYGSKIMLLMEVIIHTHQLTTFQEDFNNKALREVLDLLPMVRGDEYFNGEIAKVRMTQFYSCKIK